MKTIATAIQPQEKRVETLICSGFLLSEGIAKPLRQMGNRFALFCDHNVAIHLGQRFQEHLEHLGLCCSLFTFSPGEQEKSRETKAALEDLLLGQKYGKDTCMIALGGGVTTDLIGFLASTYCRGVPLICIPTTLLGMVDAAIGGKTGVNTPLGKNLIGAFYPAQKILIDPSTLSCLPRSEWVNGTAEVIKYALINSKELFENLKHWRIDDPDYIEKIIAQSISIKSKVVEEDFEEKKGLRHILNFGHTIAHAIELLEEYQLPHGQAVALGMLIESFLSVKMGLLSKESFDAIEALIRSFPFTLRIQPRITAHRLRDALALDKKTLGGVPRFALLEEIGRCCSFDGKYCTAVPEEILQEAINWMLTFQEKR